MQANFSTTGSCTIVGGGMAGLIAGTVLQRHGVAVTILDKGRGIGGRLASRRIAHPRYGEGVCDYGMQYFTVSDPRFQVWVAEWLQPGVVTSWWQDPASGRTCYRGTTSSRSIAQHLATSLDVRTQTCVSGLSWESPTWQIHTANSDRFQAHNLLITAPIPQTLALLDNSAIALPVAIRQRLDRVTYQPCLAVLALLDRASSIPSPGGLRLTDSALAWLADNHHQGISPRAHAITLHATPEFSRTHWQADDTVIAEILLDRAAPWLAATVVEDRVHRWLYSQPQTFYPAAYLAIPEPGLLVLAGDAFSQTPTAEPSLHLQTAMLSGLAAAEYLLKTLNPA